MTRDRSKGIVGIFFIVFILFVVFMTFAFVTVNSLKKTSGTSDLFNNKSKPIAVVEVNGTIMSSTSLIERLIKAEKDKKVKAIIIRVNSPGGAVGPTQEIYEEIRRIDKDVKPVYASFASVAASGGYYIGAATRKIYANAGTVTGSIGVIMNFNNYAELYKFAKIDPTTIKAGKYKDVGSTNRKMKPEERALMNSMVAGVHQQFIDDIVAVRGTKIIGNIQDHAQGQVFSGADAVKIGLVDSLAGLWKAGREIHKELKIKEEFGFKFIEKEKKFKFSKFLGQMQESAQDVALKLKQSGLPLFLFQAQ